MVAPFIARRLCYSEFVDRRDFLNQKTHSSLPWIVLKPEASLLRPRVKL